MPTMKVCAVKDAALDAFGQPIFVPTTAVAVRAFTTEVQNPESVYAAHPDDYSLYLLAEYADSTGSFVCCQPELLIRGKDCLRE